MDGYTTPARVVTFDGLVDGLEHLALGLGPYAEVSASSADPVAVPLVRPHSECLTGDVFGSQRCDCGAQLREAVERIAEAGGYLLYLRQEGRGIGLYRKSTPTCCRTRASILTRPTSRSATPRTSGTTRWPHRCWRP